MLHPNEDVLTRLPYIRRHLEGTKVFNDRRNPLPVLLLPCFQEITRHVENATVEIYIRNKVHRTALMSQILDKTKTKEKVKLLLDNGADVSATDIHGNTALHFAAWVGCDLDLVKLLKAYGAGPVQDKLGQLPCHIAQKLGHARLAKELCICQNRSHLKEVTFHNECVHFHDEEQFDQRLKYFQHDTITDLLNIPYIGKVKFIGEAWEIKTNVSEVVQSLCSEIGKKSPLLSNQVLPSGSVDEDTKVGLPDEFDFICLLDTFSTYCEIDQNESEIDFFAPVKIKKDVHNVNLEEFCDESNNVRAEALLDSFRNALEHSLKKLNLYNHTNMDFVDIIYKEPNCKLILQWSGCEYKSMEISIDIVPALKVPGWWPSKAKLPNVGSEANEGALLIFGRESFEDILVDNIDKDDDDDKSIVKFRISAMQVDKAFFKQLPRTIQDAYMVSKIMCNPRICPRVNQPYPGDPHHNINYVTDEPLTDKVVTSYLLKTCLFHVFCNTKDTGEIVGTNCCHEYVCKILKMFHNNEFRSFVFPLQDVTDNQGEIQCGYHDLSITRGIYSKLILTLLREPHAWVSWLKNNQLIAWNFRTSDI